MGGELETMYVCSQDPLTGSAACNGTEHSNDTGLAGLSVPAQKLRRPITSGQTTLSSREALHQRVLFVQRAHTSASATHARVYATIGNRAQRLGRLAQAGQ